MKKSFALLLVCFFIQTSNAQEEARLLRFPAIHGNQIVFSYAGDLYTLEKTGGLARKPQTALAMKRLPGSLRMAKR